MFRVATLLICAGTALALLPHAGLAASLERLVMPGPVAEHHAELEDNCDACHSPLDQETQETLCVVCHEGVGYDLEHERGLHGRHPEVAGGECQRCHREHEGRDAATLEFDWERFDHEHSDFPLRWAHAGLACESCHAPEVPRREAPGECSGCHGADDPHEGGLGSACESCHWERNWEAPLFEHASTGFVLTGAHEALSCAGCHESARFHEAESSCVSCHGDDDVHGGRFGAACADCHGSFSWGASLFDHARATGFPLTGGHGALSCESCHGGDTLTTLAGASCSSCHSEDDVHEGKNGSRCERCHGTSDWAQSRFDHEARTGFALPGVHAELSCTSCHVGALTDALPETCEGCHEDVHGGQLALGCTGCHGVWSWTSEVRFAHVLTHFPLLGSHEQLACEDCHASARFHDAPSACVGCHGDDDAHDGSLGEQCDACHNPTSWRSTGFDHLAQTGFALQGDHRALACQSCHAVPRLLRATSADACASCHGGDDVHEGRFGNACGSCHGSASWATVEQLSP